MKHKSNINRLTATFYFFIVLIITPLLFVAGCSENSSESSTKENQKIIVGCSKGNSSALIYLAQEKSFFSNESLTVEIKEFQSGVAALNAFLKGEVDLVTASEFAFVTQSFEHNDIYILASIAALKNKALLARKDSHIINPMNLKGKKVAVTANSGGEYFLGKYLDKHSISTEQLEIVYMKPQVLVEQFIAGKIDAALTWEPNVYHITKLLEDDIISWDCQGNQKNYLTLVTNQKFLTDRPDAATRFLTAIEMAERHYNKNPKEIELLLHNRFLYDPAYLASILANTEYKLEISQQLLDALNQEAQWRVAKGLSQTSNPINYKSRLHVEALKKVKPKAITLME